MDSEDPGDLNWGKSHAPPSSLVKVSDAKIEVKCILRDAVADLGRARDQNFMQFFWKEL